MSKQKIEIELDVPDGFEVVEWRPCTEGDWVIDHINGKAVASLRSSGAYRQMILRPIEPDYVKLARLHKLITFKGVQDVIDFREMSRLSDSVLASWEKQTK